MFKFVSSCTFSIMSSRTCAKLITEWNMNLGGCSKVAGGKREDPKYAQVSGFVPKDLALKFKVTCTMQETTHSESIEAALRLWLDQIKKEK